MARNDCFVIAYRILAYLYACLKEGKPVVRIERRIMITPKGIEYLQENSAMEKAKRFLKEL